MSARHFLRVIYVREVVLKQPRRPVRSSTGQFARSIAQNMIFIGSDDVIPVSATAASLDSRPTAQFERASMPRLIQLSNDLVMSDNVFGSSLDSEDHSHYLLWNDTEKSW